MPNLTPYDAIIIIGLLVALFALNRYAAHLEHQIRKRDRDRTRKAREEDLARVARMHNYSRRAGSAAMPPTDVKYTGWTPRPAYPLKCAPCAALAMPTPSAGAEDMHRRLIEGLIDLAVLLMIFVAGAILNEPQDED